MGWIPDANFRNSNIRKYLLAKVQAARDLVYRLGHSVAGVRVDDLLKLTSSVPVLVSGVLPAVDLQFDQWS